MKIRKIGKYILKDEKTTRKNNELKEIMKSQRRISFLSLSEFNKNLFSHLSTWKKNRKKNSLSNKLYQKEKQPFDKQAITRAEFIFSFHFQLCS